MLRCIFVGNQIEEIHDSLIVNVIKWRRSLTLMNSVPLWICELFTSVAVFLLHLYIINQIKSVFRLEQQNFRSKDWYVIFKSFSPRTKNVKPQKTQCRKNCRNGQSRDWLVTYYFSPFEMLSVRDWKLKLILIPVVMCDVRRSCQGVVSWTCDLVLALGQRFDSHSRRSFCCNPCVRNLLYIT